MMEPEEENIGPVPAPRSRRKRPLQFEQAYLDALPSANMYEKSYMHRDVVTHVAVSAADFFITGSVDGHLKFWKKKPLGIEFAKHFRSHLGPIEGLSVSADGLLCCTISNDRSVKVYDVVNYDMMVMIRLPYEASCIEWVYKQGDVKAKLAISDRNSSFVYIYDARAGTNEPISSREIHSGPVKVMRYNQTFDTIISADSMGIIEYWSAATLQFPEDVVSWTSMVSGYENNDQPEKALETYRMIESEGVKPDEITLASVLSACTTLGLLDIGIKLHELAIHTGLISYIIVANKLIHLYSKCKCIDKALHVFYQIRSKNVISWTSIIRELRINNRSFEAISFFRQMQRSLYLNSATVVSVLSACARIGALMCGKEIHARVLRNGLAFDGFVPNALFDMLSDVFKDPPPSFSVFHQALVSFATKTPT